MAGNRVKSRQTQLTMGHWRRGTGTPHANLRISAVSVVPAGDHLAYQGSTTGDTASTTVDIPRIILAVSGTHEHR